VKIKKIAKENNFQEKKTNYRFRKNAFSIMKAPNKQRFCCFYKMHSLRVERKKENFSFMKTFYFFEDF
jgi:hypothetical protein